MKGWRTIAVNVGLAAATGGLQAAANINWIDVVGPTWAMGIIAAVNIGLRAITTSPVGKKY